MSLGAWYKGGVLEREIALYQTLQEMGCQIVVVSYGGPSERQLQSHMPGIRLLCNQFELPPRLYRALVPWLHGKALRAADLLKTNQMKGSGVALMAARAWKRPLVVRCGYIWSALARSGGHLREAEWKQARRLEQQVLPHASRIIVTTPSMRDYVEHEYAVGFGRVRVIPNYVLTRWFESPDQRVNSNRVCFVGRLEEEKNPLALVRACSDNLCDLVMVGDGPLRDDLQAEGARLGVRLTLMGRVLHRELVPLLRESALFAIVSRHEGHPKTLLEAMACGVSVLGADSPGIRELIEHGETGWLCDPDPPSIRGAIRHLLSRPQLRAKLGRNARQYILENFTLERVVDLEYRLIAELVAEGHRQESRG